MIPNKFNFIQHISMPANDEPFGLQYKFGSVFVCLLWLLDLPSL